MARKSKIDWDNIKITFVPADMDNPNPLNPFARMTPKERREAAISKCAEIWARIARDKLLADRNEINRQKTCIIPEIGYNCYKYTFNI
jgi:hypothetical protein